VLLTWHEKARNFKREREIKKLTLFLFSWQKLLEMVVLFVSWPINVLSFKLLIPLLFLHKHLLFYPNFNLNPAVSDWPPKIVPSKPASSSCLPWAAAGAEGLKARFLLI
jgi:hypothetical protein